MIRVKKVVKAKNTAAMRQMRSATIGVLALLGCLDVSSAQMGGMGLGGLGGLDTKAMRDAMISARAKNAGVELEEDESKLTRAKFHHAHTRTHIKHHAELLALP